jgi:ADP-ribose pyrophosphatase
VPELSTTEPLEDTPYVPHIVSSGLAYKGKVWDVRTETFEYNGEKITREFVAHTGAVAVFAMDENENVLLIRQYRHPIRSREWELPAGLLDIAGEDPLIGAKRELAEEADIVATDWAVLTDFQTSPGGSNEALRVYLARGVSAAPEAFARTDEEFDIEVRWASLDEIVEAVLARKIQNSILAISALAADALRRRGWDSLADENAPWTRHPSFGASVAGQTQSGH